MNRLGWALDALDTPRVRSLYVYSSNPAVVAPDQKSILFVRNTVGDPTEIWRCSFPDKTMKRLTSFNEAVAQDVDIRPAEDMWVKGAGGDMVLTLRGSALTVLPKPESPHHLWHPSVELLGRSVLEHCDPARVVGVMLTGMGYDGADSFAEIKKNGGRTIAESESSAVVFGMPAELIKRGGAEIVLSADKVAAQVCSWVGVR